MEKIAVFTDSASDLNDNDYKKHNIKFLPLQIIYENKTYKDKIDIDASTVYENLKNEIPKTSLPSGESIDKLFKGLIKDGYTHAIGIMISGGLSGTFNAVKLMSQEYPEIETFVFDSKTLSVAQGAFVKKAALMVEANVPFTDICKNLEDLRPQIDTYYYVDTLEYLIQGGRIGKVQGTIGKFLNIKPIISIDNDGVYYTIEKARGKNQAYNKLYSLLKNDLSKNTCNVWVMHGGAETECTKIYNTVKTFDNINNIYTGQISPSLGVHTGPGLIGICVERLD